MFSTSEALAARTRRIVTFDRRAPHLVLWVLACAGLAAGSVAAAFASNPHLSWPSAAAAVAFGAVMGAFAAGSVKMAIPVRWLGLAWIVFKVAVVTLDLVVLFGQSRGTVPSAPSGTVV